MTVCQKCELRARGFSDPQLWEVGAPPELTERQKIVTPVDGRQYA